MLEFLKRTWAEVNLDALGRNIRLIQEKLPEKTRVMGVVKADAYGHGDRLIARELEKAGVNDFAVSNLEEALSLRRGGLEGEILILGVTPPEHAGKLFSYNITQTVFSSEYAQALSMNAVAAKASVKCHLKLDTGMGRIGFVAGQDGVCAEIQAVCELPGLAVQGVFSHFSSADDCTPAGIAYTKEQRARFNKALEELGKIGLSFQSTHIQNSAGILNYGDCRYDLARAGLILYGMPVDTFDESDKALCPVMSIRSIVSMVKTVHPGDCISYSRTFTAEREMRLATIPIGYADGYPRALSNKAEILIRGKRARIVGNVCMDQLMVDVSGIEGVKAGDVATIVGTDGSERVSFEELAGIAGTINYEIVCLVGKRVPRVYYKHGKVVGVVNYLSDN